jgi:hypothetical protein
MSGTFFIVERFSLCISFSLSDYMYLVRVDPDLSIWPTLAKPARLSHYLVGVYACMYTLLSQSQGH